MVDDDLISRVPCYLEDIVKKNDYNFCVVCFVCGENIDIDVTSSYSLSIMKYFSEHESEFSKIPDDFYIQVISTRSFIKFLEVLRK